MGWHVIHAYRLRLICSLIFDCPFRFFLLVHRLLPTFMVLILNFAAPTRRFSVLFLTFNMVVNKHSYFPALGILTGDDVIVTLVLSSVTSSGVDTISASRKPLRFYWSSHLPTCWYIYFMLFIPLCSKEDLMLPSVSNHVYWINLLIISYLLTHLNNNVLWLNVCYNHHVLKIIWRLLVLTNYYATGLLFNTNVWTT